MLATMPPKASSASSPCSTARHLRVESVPQNACLRLARCAITASGFRPLPPLKYHVWTDASPRRSCFATGTRLRQRELDATSTRSATAVQQPVPPCVRTRSCAPERDSIAQGALICGRAAPNLPDAIVAASVCRGPAEPGSRVVFAERHALLVMIRLRQTAKNPCWLATTRRMQFCAHACRRDFRRYAGALAVAVMRSSTGPSNTGDKLRSGARVHAANRRGHSAAPPAERRLRREGWCRRKLRQLHPLVRPRVDASSAPSSSRVLLSEPNVRLPCRPICLP